MSEKAQEAAKKAAASKKEVKCKECGSVDTITRESGYVQCQDCNYLDRGSDEA